MRIVVLLAALVSACASDAVRIDGTSSVSFAESHRKLVHSLSLADQTKLLLAEAVIRAAATPTRVADAPGTVPEMVPLEAVRGELNGKTFNEILQLSKSRDIEVKVGFITQPVSGPGARAQESPDPAKAPSYSLERIPLPGSTTESLGIKQLPLEVDMELAAQFVRIGFGPQILGQRGFQSTEFLTPPLSTTQAAELVRIVPEYGTFKGASVAEGIKRFAGRVISVQFGREGSPVLYVQLPYWTHQREGPITRGMGTRISEEDNKRLVEELRKVFVDELGAEEFGSDAIDSRKVRIWWHH